LILLFQRLQLTEQPRKVRRRKEKLRRTENRWGAATESAQTETNPAQPLERLANADERYLRRSADCLENRYVVGSKVTNGEMLMAEKAVELYEQHLAENFSERIRHCLHDKISPTGAHSTSRVTPTRCCESPTHGRSSASGANPDNCTSEPSDFESNAYEQND
jgi:hypothetical protein